MCTNIVCVCGFQFWCTPCLLQAVVVECLYSCDRLRISFTFLRLSVLLFGGEANLLDGQTWS